MQHMPLLPNAGTRRNIARAMLFVWLFALVSGLANACQLEPREIHHHGQPSSQQSSKDTALDVIGHQSDAHTHDDGDSDTGTTKKSCLKVCDEGSQSLLKHASSFDLVDPGLAPFAAAAWAIQVRLAPALDRIDDFRLLERGPPIRVLFSRLAI